MSNPTEVNDDLRQREEALSQIQTIAYDGGLAFDAEAGKRGPLSEFDRAMEAKLNRICRIAEAAVPDEDWRPPSEDDDPSVPAGCTGYRGPDGGIAHDDATCPVHEEDGAAPWNIDYVYRQLATLHRLEAEAEAEGGNDYQAVDEFAADFRTDFLSVVASGHHEGTARELAQAWVFSPNPCATREQAVAMIGEDRVPADVLARLVEEYAGS